MDADEAEWFRFVRTFKPSPAATIRRRRTWRLLLVHHDHEDLVEEDGDNNLGIIRPETSTILLDASRATRVIHATAMHEISHAILYDGWPPGMPESKAKVDLEEAIIHGLTPTLDRIARPQWPAFTPEAQGLIRMARKKRPR